MKITKLDNFGEGFKVTPRPKHKHNKAESTKQLTLAEQQMPFLIAIENRLINDGYVQVAVFKNTRKLYNSIFALRKRRGMNIESVKSDGVVVGYRLIGQ